MIFFNTNNFFIIILRWDISLALFPTLIELKSIFWLKIGQNWIDIKLNFIFSFIVFYLRLFKWAFFFY